MKMTETQDLQKQSHSKSLREVKYAFKWRCDENVQVKNVFGYMV